MAVLVSSSSTLDVIPDPRLDLVCFDKPHYMHWSVSLPSMPPIVRAIRKRVPRGGSTRGVIPLRICARVDRCGSSSPPRGSVYNTSGVPPVSPPGGTSDSASGGTSGGASFGALSIRLQNALLGL